jgi:sulfate adenylyltransferase
VTTTPFRTIQLGVLAQPLGLLSPKPVSIFSPEAIDRAIARGVYTATALPFPAALPAWTAVISGVMQQSAVNLAGPVKVLSDGGFSAKYGALFMTPAETRAI